MKKEDFVKNIIKYLRVGTFQNIIDNLNDPPGRCPTEKSIVLSEYYKKMNEYDKSNIDKIIMDSVDEAIFGFLCILDGVRPLVENEKYGVLSLRYLQNDDIYYLNDLNDVMLHDLYKEGIS